MQRYEKAIEALPFYVKEDLSWDYCAPYLVLHFKGYHQETFTISRLLSIMNYYKFKFISESEHTTDGRSGYEWFNRIIFFDTEYKED